MITANAGPNHNRRKHAGLGEAEDRMRARSSGQVQANSSNGGAAAKESNMQGMARSGNQTSNGLHLPIQRTRVSLQENPPPRLSSFVTPINRAKLQQKLEEMPSRWPPWVQRWRISLYLFLEEPRSSWAAQVLQLFMMACIAVSIAAYLLETMPELSDVPKDVWKVIETVSTILFTIEYCARLCVCSVKGLTTWKFVKSPMNLIDLGSIMPLYLTLAMSNLDAVKAFGVIRTIRLVRLFRVFKLGRYSQGLQVMLVAVRNSSHALWALSFFLGIAVVLFSSTIYYVEKMGCPDREAMQGRPHPSTAGRSEYDHYVEECRSLPYRESSYGLCCTEHDAPLDFPTIIAASWWAIVTMTTVGFGEVVPKTDLGRLVGTVTMFSGILLIALPIAIIGRKFQEAYQDYVDSLNPSPSIRPAKAPEAGHEPGHMLHEMGRRLHAMHFEDEAVANLAMEVVDKMHEAADIQKEIASMEMFEQKKRVEVLEHFNGILSVLNEQSAAVVMAHRAR